MILVSVGTQLPFDRLIGMVDELAPEFNMRIFAQTGRGQYAPKNIEWRPDVSPEEFDSMVSGASVLVAHAGIGTVLKAYKFMKPLILVPRVAALGEHRNDHQLATVSQLQGRLGIYGATTKVELRDLLRTDLEPARPSEVTFAARQRLQDFVAGEVKAAIRRRKKLAV